MQLSVNRGNCFSAIDVLEFGCPPKAKLKCHRCDHGGKTLRLMGQEIQLNLRLDSYGIDYTHRPSAQAMNSSGDQLAAF